MLQFAIVGTIGGWVISFLANLAGGIGWADEAADLWGRWRSGVGTKFSQIEAESLEVGRELSRLMMEQAVDEQSERVPSSALEKSDSGEPAAMIGTEPSVLETTAGEVQWKQPKTRLSQARRDFFPSGQGTRR